MTSIVLMFFVFDSKATVYTSIADGNYNNCAIWDVGCPNNTIQNGDTVIDFGKGYQKIILNVLMLQI